MGESCPGAPRRAGQAFVLGWAVTNLGGVNEVIRNLVREFARSGPLAPVVIEAGSQHLPRSAWPEAPVLRLDFPAPYEPQNPVKAFVRFCGYLVPGLWRLYITCRRYNIQVLNPHFIGLAYFILVLFRRSGLFGGKLLFSFHGSDVRVMMRSKGAERFLYRVLLRGADVLIPCSEGLGEEIALFAPECAARIAAVHNGINIERFLSSADPSFCLPESFRARKKLFNIGAFEYKKAHDVLIRAFARVREKRNDVCLLIAGQRGHRLDATKELIRELGLENDVLALVDLPHAHVASLMQLSDLFVLSSRWDRGICGEGFAVALLEAAAACVPVISTESCGVNELVKNGSSGIVVPTNQPELLAAGIEFFLDNPEEALRQARNLHEVVRRQFTWTGAHRRYLELAGVAPGPGASEPAVTADPVESEKTSSTSPVLPSHDG